MQSGMESFFVQSRISISNYIYASSLRYRILKHKMIIFDLNLQWFYRKVLIIKIKELKPGGNNNRSIIQTKDLLKVSIDAGLFSIPNYMEQRVLM